MAKNQDGQLELVLENRQLLIAFFVVVALCGVFFSLGYIVGRNTFSSVARVTQAASGAEAANKPSPMPPAAYAAPAASKPPATSPETSDTDLNFYQSAEENPPAAKLLPSEPASSPTLAPSSAPAPERPAPPEPSGILVQVSALTRREDANALVSLLKEKKLPVIVSSSSSDALFHVVVGPYKTDKEAQAAKKSLEEDGFRPILKR